MSTTEQYPFNDCQPTAEQLLEAGSEFLNYFEVDVDPLDRPEEFRKALHQLDPRYKGARSLVRYLLPI